MNAVFAPHSIGISELRDAPAKIFAQAKDSAVVVLNHNQPAGYIVSPQLMERLMDQVVDRIVSSRAQQRLQSLDSARAISINDL